MIRNEAEFTINREESTLELLVDGKRVWIKDFSKVRPRRNVVGDRRSSSRWVLRGQGVQVMTQTAADVLEGALTLIERDGHWQGQPVVKGYCVLMAMSCAWDGHGLAASDARFELSEHLGHPPLATWSDTTPTKEVTATMREVAARLRKRGR